MPLGTNQATNYLANNPDLGQYYQENIAGTPEEADTDLETGILRAIGDPKKRFQEDALMLMRAIRFAIVTGFEIE